MCTSSSSSDSSLEDASQRRAASRLRLPARIKLAAVKMRISIGFYSRSTPKFQARNQTKLPNDHQNCPKRGIPHISSAL